MNKVFQQAVTGILREILKEEHPEYKLHSDRWITSLVKEGTLKIRPDILIEGPNGILVIDTKYKDTKENSRGSVADYYQIIAYLIALKNEGIRKGCLIYPSESATKKGKPFTLCTSVDKDMMPTNGKPLITEYLNMTRTEKNYIETLKDRLKAILDPLLNENDISLCGASYD